MVIGSISAPSAVTMKRCLRPRSQRHGVRSRREATLTAGGRTFLFGMYFDVGATNAGKDIADSNVVCCSDPHYLFPHRVDLCLYIILRDRLGIPETIGSANSAKSNPQ